MYFNSYKIFDKLRKKDGNGMPRRLTQGEFLLKARVKHGLIYDYSKVCYVNGDSEVIIICPVHGEFTQGARHHYEGSGCVKCRGLHTPSNDEFIEVAKNTHGDCYDYSQIHYINRRTKIKIICPVHGEFEQFPNDHINGSGCSQCRSDSMKLTHADFINRCAEKHNGKYDYSLVEYLHNSLNIKIICPEHGIFEQMANSHIQGHGCPGCARSGYDATKPGTLYMLRSACGKFVKIGISNNYLKRFKSLKETTPFDFYPVEIYTNQDGSVAPYLEKQFHNLYQSAGFTGFGGATEWLMYDPRLSLCFSLFHNNS